MLLQSPYVARFQLFDTSILDRVNIFTGQAGRIDQSGYIRLFGMDRLAEGTPGCMISRLYHVRRGPNARAAIRTEVEKRQRRIWFRRYADPRAFRDLAKRDLPCSAMREPVLETLS